MGKWFGKIGYAFTEETRPGIWRETISERSYYGELTRDTRRLASTSNLNDDINIANLISIVADPFARDHFHAMKYVEIYGARWKISNVEVQYPRLVLTVGGVYNGPTP